MNKIFITNQANQVADDNTYTLTYEQANKMLPILRSDHFKVITLANTRGLDVKSLKFLIQITRLLKTDGSVVLKGESSLEVKGLLAKLNLFEGTNNNDEVSFLKTRPEIKIEQKVSKLSIGFNPNQQQTIDEDDLLKGQNLDISKKPAEKCDTKPKACANCSCGRKQTEKNGPVPVGELVNSINEGKVMTGCGKCSLGDSFRCGTCPYKGFPAFKPGDKLKLMEEGGVAVEQAATFVSATGKVKLEI